MQNRYTYIRYYWSKGCSSYRWFFSDNGYWKGLGFVIILFFLLYVNKFGLGTSFINLAKDIDLAKQSVKTIGISFSDIKAIQNELNFRMTISKIQAVLKFTRERL